MMKAITYLCLCIFLLLSQQALASSRYKIEVLIFKHLSLGNETAEKWRENYVLDIPSNVIELDAYSYGDTESYPTLSSNHLTMGAIADRLNGSGFYQTIFHTAWQQPVSISRYAKPVLIRSNDSYAEFPITGLITVSKGRYLHTSLHLVMENDNIIDNSIETTENYMNLINSDTTTYSTVLQHKRRMKSKEIHYIDHAMFGVLIYITPL